MKKDDKPIKQNTYKKKQGVILDKSIQNEKSDNEKKAIKKIKDTINKMTNVKMNIDDTTRDNAFNEKFKSILLMNDNNRIKQVLSELDINTNIIESKGKKELTKLQIINKLLKLSEGQKINIYDKLLLKPKSTNVENNKIKKKLSTKEIVQLIQKEGIPRRDRDGLLIPEEKIKKDKLIKLVKLNDEQKSYYKYYNLKLPVTQEDIKNTNSAIKAKQFEYYIRNQVSNRYNKKKKKIPKYIINKFKKNDIDLPKTEKDLDNLFIAIENNNSDEYIKKEKDIKDKENKQRNEMILKGF